MPHALIQLVSEQTMPNLLPVLALRPARLIFLTTPVTAARAPAIAAAVAKAGVQAAHEGIRLSAMPSIAESRRAVERAAALAREHGHEPILNFTGGTKLMSIGAHAAAAAARVPSFYVDPQSHTFLDGGTGDGLAQAFGGDLGFARIAPTLGLDVVVVANGHRGVTPGRDWETVLPAARHLLENPVDENAVHGTLTGAGGLFGGKGEPRTPEDWLPYLRKPFPLPEPVLAPLVEAGILRRHAGGRALLPDHTVDDLRAAAMEEDPRKRTPLYFRAVAPLQQATAFLTGGWWEVVLADAARQSGRFHDLRWSASVIQQSGTHLEEDVLALDGTEAVCISCKRGGQRDRLASHIEELSSRSRAIGGRFSRAFLALRHPPSRSTTHRLLRRAEELGIVIITPEDLGNPAAFDPRRRG